MAELAMVFLSEVGTGNWSSYLEAIMPDGWRLMSVMVLEGELL
jgi:hypothetical protein